MDVFNIWTVPGSPFARAVMVTLEEKGLPWQIRPLAPMDSKGPAHLARNPFGRMPVVEHGDFRLYETQAVMRYADRLSSTPALTPSDPRAEARMNQLMGISDWYLFPQVSAASSLDGSSRRSSASRPTRRASRRRCPRPTSA